LVTAAEAGDQLVWNALVQEFAGLVWSVARAHRLGKADASDVSQTTWLRLLEHLGRLKEPGSVGAWLATTARRECLRVLREHQRCAPYGDKAPDYESSDISPDDKIVLSERHDAVRRSFSRLPASDQALLRLLMADPRPAYEEIADALDMPIGSIGPTRQRALARLRRELDRQGTLTLMTD
jgi:RNA polymerase sigma factor (sigma-70 family)